MCRTLLINKAERYDVKGKRILNGKYKYYLSDLGLGQNNYPKYVISTDTFDMSQDGIIHKNIIDWLLEDEK